MPILAVTNLRHAFGHRVVLDGVSLSIEAGERVGMVGRNGTGKSTLLKSMAGLVMPDAGDIALQKGSKVGYLHQDPKLDPEDTLKEAAEAAFEELHGLHRAMDALYEEMATAQGSALDRLMKKQEDLERRIEAAGGYAIEHKVEEILHGLGFSDAQMNVKVGGLSGGQKGRLALAQLLLEQPDVLLLDEPTNHLDIDGRRWLEQFLVNEYTGAVLMISHDRYLLDGVVDRILEVEGKRLFEYPGNYADFREIRAERRLSQLRAFSSQQQRIKKEEEYIRRFKAGQRARQAKGRERRLDREKADNLIERPMEMALLEFELPKAERTSDVVVSCRGLSKAYPLESGGQKVLFRDLDLSIARGERWGIIGPNGAGKSTLVRCLLGEQVADAGATRLGTNVKIGHYKQTHEHIPAELAVWQFLQRAIVKENPQASFSEQQARNLAGAFLFSGDDQDRLMHVLSGGERSRAALAALLASSKNLLVLDEPTNHLDIPSAERLEDALSPDGGYDGTLILISHDRALIDATCDHLLVLDGNGNIEIFLGGYSDWFERHQTRERERQREEAEAKRKRDEAESRRKSAEDARKAAQKAAAPPSANSLSKITTTQLEQRIEKIETRVRAIDAELLDPAVWRDAVRSQRLGDERARLQRELEPLEFEWARRAAEE